MPKGGQPQGQGGGADNSLAPFFAILAIGGISYFIWYKEHALIVSLFFLIKSAEISLIELFVNIPVLSLWKRYIEITPPENVSWVSFQNLCNAVGYYLRYPAGAILVALGVWIYTKNVGLRFRRTYNMKLLRDQEQQNWPQIMPVISKDLIKEDVRIGPWAMALTPMEFAKQHNLLKKDEFAQAAMSNIDLPLTAGIRKGEARRIFTLQLGAYWYGFDALNPYTKALAAVFIAKINRDRDGATKLLKILSESAAKGRLDVTLVPDLLNKHKNTPLIQEIVGQHAYIMTVMASLMERARDDGVLASADFLWLKPVDRRLWYILNNIGRQTAFVEVGGIFAHWMAEKTLAQKSLSPMIEEAVKALELAIKEIKLTPKEWGALAS